MNRQALRYVKTGVLALFALYLIWFDYKNGYLDFIINRPVSELQPTKQAQSLHYNKAPSVNHAKRKHQRVKTTEFEKTTTVTLTTDGKKKEKKDEPTTLSQLKHNDKDISKENHNDNEIQDAKQQQIIESGNAVEPAKEDNSKSDQLVREETEKPKLILAYTTVYGNLFKITRWSTNLELQDFPNPLDQCDHKCVWSTDKNDYEKSDAILFHLYNLAQGNKMQKEFVLQNLPARYRSDQKWVLMVREPGALFYSDQLKVLNDRFNLTMTYQSDSDVSIPYGRYWTLPSEQVEKRYQQNIDYSTGRSKMVLWLANNCVTSSQREKYVSQLRQYVAVDIYGKCGTEYPNPNAAQSTVLNTLGKEYKFYLAFESADCDDFVTDEFWSSLEAGMIPIVRSERVDYKKIAPPYSYIHTNAFGSPLELASYLNHVAATQDLFKQYHNWRMSYDAAFQIISSNRRWMCDLCEKVHEKTVKTVNVYQHLSEDTRCFAVDRTRDRSAEQMQNLNSV